MKNSKFSIFLVMLFAVVILFSTTSSSYKPISLEMYNTNEGYKNSNFAIYPDVKTVETSSQNICERLLGFNGLVCSPDSIQNPIDIYSSAKGNPSCNSNYSNSKGQLCMDTTQLKLLSSRGGNVNRL